MRDPGPLEDGFGRVMRILAARAIAMPEAGLVNRFLGYAYRKGMEEMNRPVSTHMTRLDEGLAKYDETLLAFAITERPGLLDAGPLHPKEAVNGVEIGAAALKAHADAVLRSAIRVWEGPKDGERHEGIEDGYDIVDARGTFPARFLSLRMLDVTDSEAYSALVMADESQFQAALVVAAWWRERLERSSGDGGREHVTPEQASAFEVALADIVALVGPKTVAVDYHADACIGAALYSSGLPPDEAEAWQKTAVAMNRRTGIISAKVGYGGTHVEIGRFPSETSVSWPSP